MIELKGVETDRAEELEADPHVAYVIFKDGDVELKPGDEVVMLVSGTASAEYAIPLMISGVYDGAEPGEAEFLVRYGDKLFVAQKLPEFI